MKKLTIAFAAALLPLVASAEITAGTIQVSGGSNLSALAGSLEETFKEPGVPNVVEKTDLWNFNLEAGALYYLTPMIGVGLDVGYDSMAAEYKYDQYKVTETNLFIGPKVGLELPLAEKLSVFGDLGLGLVKYTAEHEDTSTGIKVSSGGGSGVGFRVGAGVKYFLIPAISVDAGLRYRYESYSYSFPGTDIDAKRGAFGLVVGLSGYFGGSK